MHIDLIPKKLTGKLYQEISNTECVFLREMILLDFIKEFGYFPTNDSFYDKDRGIVTIYRFKARKEKLFLEIDGKDIPKEVFS